MTSTADYDVAILGAGAAGLAAAAELSQHGRSVLLLEARERIGGRICTHLEPGLAHPIELGAEFIHGEAPHTRALLKAAGIAAVETAGERFTRRGAGFEPRGGEFGGVRRLLRQAASLPQDLSVAQFLAGYAADPAQREVAAFVRTMVEGFDAADPQRASVKAIAAEWSDGNLGGQHRPLGGYAPLMTYLAGSLDASRSRLMLGTTVEAVDWSGSLVRISARAAAGSLATTAHQAIVTLPVSLLQTHARDAVRFEPALTAKSGALGQLALGPVIKVVLHFRDAFWETLAHGQLREAGFLHAPEAPFPTIWTALPARVPLLTAWMGGPRAQRLYGAPRAQLIEQALVSVRQVLGVDALVDQLLVRAHLHDWSTDPHAQGAYSYLTVGGQQAPEMLAEPLQNRLFFAGEATDPDQIGTVEAALQSGQRAARALLDAMGGNDRR